MPEPTASKPGQLSKSHLLSLMKSYGRMLQSDVDRILFAASAPSDQNMAVALRSLKALQNGAKDLQTLLLNGFKADPRKPALKLRRNWADQARNNFHSGHDMTES